MSSNTAVTNAKEQIVSKLNDLTANWSPKQRLVATLAATAVTASGLTIFAGCLLCRACHGSRGKAGKGYGQSDAVYASEESARQYMEFHYTPSRDSYVHRARTISEAFDFPTRVVQKFKIYLPGNKKNLRGLDVGCATGASALEMTKFFDGGVVGIDLSEVFIHLANEVVESAKSGGALKVRYTAPVQGDITEERELHIPENIFAERAVFHAGDAMRMFEEDGKLEVTESSRYPDVSYWQSAAGEKFDGILCLNLIDRVPDPDRLLKSFSRLLNRGGILILADPYSWWENATAKEKWLGGHDGKRSEDVIKEALSEDFELKTESDEAFLIRDHVRHYQLGFSHCTVWKRR